MLAFQDRSLALGGLLWVMAFDGAGWVTLGGGPVSGDALRGDTSIACDLHLAISSSKEVYVAYVHGPMHGDLATVRKFALGRGSWASGAWQLVGAPDALGRAGLERHYVRLGGLVLRQPGDQPVIAGWRHTDVSNPPPGFVNPSGPMAAAFDGTRWAWLGGTSFNLNSTWRYQVFTRG